MKLLRLTSLIASIALLSPSLAAAKDNIKRSIIRHEGKDRVCTFFVPDNVSGPRPAIMLLHGSGRNGRIMIDQWKDLAQKEGILLVAPDAYDAASWSPKWDTPQFLRACIGKLHEFHPVDLQRIYVFGHSAGAEYALILAVVDPLLYAAAAVHAGILLPELNAYLPNVPRRMPIAIWVGDRDPFFSVTAVNETAHSFEHSGFSVKLTIMPQHDHNYYAVSEEVNRKVWDFFKGLTAPPSAPGASTVGN